MTPMTRSLTAALTFLAFPAFADLREGLTALETGNFEAAAASFAAAVDEGEADGHFYLGRMLELGMGGQPDLVTAVEIYKKGAEAKSALAQNRLGLLHLDGQLVLQDYERAAELLCASAEAGDANGLFNCALLKLEGRGIEADTTAAVEQLKASVEQDHVAAMNVLAQIYVGGELGEPDVDAGIKLFQKTASFGNPVGLYAIGQAYVLGLGIDKDLVRAHAYFNLAATRQHPEALQARQMLDQQLEPAQVLEAQRIARGWRPVEMENKSLLDGLAAE